MLWIASSEKGRAAHTRAIIPLHLLLPLFLCLAALSVASAADMHVVAVDCSSRFGRKISEINLAVEHDASYTFAPNQDADQRTT